MHDRNGILINCLFFFPMRSLHYPQYWMVPCKEKLARCVVCNLRDPPVAEITFLVSKTGSREGRCRTQNNAAMEELHSVLPSGSNSCFKLNYYLRSHCHRLCIVFSVFHMVDTKCKYKIQLQQKLYFKVQSKHFIFQLMTSLWS